MEESEGRAQASPAAVAGAEPELPSICVVVPVLNGAATIDACVQSLLAQDYPADRFEVVIVDNGSTDSTTRRVGSYPVRLVTCSIPGAAAARNFGARATTAEIVAFTDADCVAHAGWLRNLAPTFGDAKVGAAGGPIDALRHDSRTMVERFAEDSVPLMNFQSGEGEFLPHLFGANAAYRRELLLSAGGWDDELLLADDVELSWRFQLRTKTVFAFSPDAVVFHQHRQSARSLARQYWMYGLGEALIDTQFRDAPGYPRSLRFYAGRLASQVGAMVRAVASGGKRGWLHWRGMATAYEAVVPWLWLLIEASNVAGKVQGVWLTRGLRYAEPLRRFFAHRVRREYKPERRR